jgi:ribosomal protein L25 (general stress protein Ctc)
MCRLQDYFDQRVSTHSAPLRALNEQSTETSNTERDERGHVRHVVVGEGTYVLASRLDRLRFRNVLRENYRRVPEMGLAGTETTVRVRTKWWQAGGIRRVRSDGEVEVQVADRTWTFPPHPCVGEFLFGESAYVMRRCFVEAEQARAQGRIPGECSVASSGAAQISEPDTNADAGSTPPSASLSEAGVATDASAPQG